jgi:hypothetical protein
VWKETKCVCETVVVVVELVLIDTDDAAAEALPSTASLLAVGGVALAQVVGHLVHHQGTTDDGVGAVQGDDGVADVDDGVARGLKSGLG